MKLAESILTRNPCYAAGRKITVKGLMLHSVGCPQPKASVFINSWNSPAHDSSCVHGFIDGNDGTVYQTLPWNHRGWHCGSGNKGSGNNTHIGVEMCEPACIKYTAGSNFTCSDMAAAKAVAKRTYEAAVELFANLCKKYGLDPLADGVVISHKEGCSRGIASNHGDPEHLWTQLGIAKRLTEEGVRTPAGKEKWHSCTVKSILVNEKYKGDALLQKSYTVDFLTKKTKINEGEVPQYYVENSHEAIISPAVFDEVQHQMAVRHPGKNRLSCTGAFSSRIKCGDCGSWYGSKVWHSNDKYRKVVWQCNHKFDGGEKCTTPHLDEAAVKALFLKAANAAFDERDGIREDYEAVKERLYDTSGLEAERIQLQDERNIVAEMIQQCVNENARIALDQTEYQKKYDGLADRFDRIKERLEAVGSAITERMAKREKTERFLAELEKRDGPLTEFNEEDWYSLVEYATVYSREDIRFTFKNGMEIKA